MKNDRYILLRGVMIGLGGFLLVFSIVPMLVNILNIGMLVGAGLGIFFLALGFFLVPIGRFTKRLWEGKLKYLFLAILIIGGLGLTGYGTTVGLVVSGMYARVQDCDTVIVLGCLVNGEKPSLLLKYRIDAAAEYLEAHPEAVCIVSGGMGERESITEASCMKRELVALGIDESRIYEEDRSTDTRENIAYSKEIIETEGLSDRVAIITNDFHVYRGRMLARQAGLEAYGVPARSRITSRVCYVLREACGLWYYIVFE